MTLSYDKLTTAVQEGLAAFREDEERRITRLVLAKCVLRNLLGLNIRALPQVGDGDQRAETHSNGCRPRDKPLGRLQRSCRRTR